MKEGRVISFTVPGKSFGKQRPRFTSRGKSKAFTAKETVSYESYVRVCAHWVAPSPLFEGPVRMKIKEFRTRPKSVPKYQDVPVSKPDVDNVAKIILDSLEGIVYPRDSQIYRLDFERFFDDPARVEVTIVEGIWDR